MVKKFLLLFCLITFSVSADWTDGYKTDSFEIIEQEGMSAPSVSSAGQVKTYFDSSTNKWMASTNGGAYAEVGAGGAAVEGTAVLSTGELITKYLRADGDGTSSWQTVPVGDLVGPASSTDNSVPTYDSTTGKLLQDQGALFIDDTGQVGIGVADPDVRLEVSGNIHLTTNSDKLLLGTASDASIYYDGTDMIIASENVTASDDIIFSNFDAVKINTAAAYGFQLTRSSGVAALVGATSSGDASLILDASNGDGAGGDYFVTSHVRAGNYLGMGYAAANDLVILSSGNVGIGTTSPTTKLTVSGSLNLLNDNDKLLFGAASDASVYFDGTDAQFASSGDFDFLGGEISLTKDQDYIGYRFGESAAKYAVFQWRNTAERADFSTASNAYPINIRGSAINFDLDNMRISMGAAGAVDSYLSWDTTNLQHYSSGGHQFTGTIGMGTAPVASQALRISKDYSETSGSFFGEYFNPDLSSPSNGTASLFAVGQYPSVSGAYNVNSLITQFMQPYVKHTAGTLSNLYGLYINPYYGATAAGQTTGYYGINIGDISKHVDSTENILTAYQLYMAEQTQANTNWQIYSAGGNNYFGSGTHNFVGNVVIGNGATSAGVIAINEDTDDGTNNATFTVPALAGDTDYTLPVDDGDNTEVLQTNGSGVLEWVANEGSGLWTDLTPNLEPNDDGDGIQINDSGGTDFVVQTHDGTDYNFVGTNTVQYTYDLPINIGGTAQSTISEGLVVNDSSGADADDDFRVETGAEANALVVDASGETIEIRVSLDVDERITGEPKHLRFNIFDPLGVQTDDTQVCIWPKTDAAITITNLEVTLDAAGNEVAGDVKWADTFIGLASAAVINDFDTTSGVRSDSSIATGAVASGKCIYIQFDSAPNTAITQMSVDIQYDYD